MVWISCWALPGLAIYGVLQIINSLFGERIALYVDGKPSFIQPFWRRLDSNLKKQMKNLLVIKRIARILKKICRGSSSLFNQIILRSEIEKNDYEYKWKAVYEG